MNQNNNINLQELQELERKLITEYQKLESEERGLETVIQCQTRRNEIQALKKDIEQKLYEVKRQQLEENEDYKEKMNQAENRKEAVSKIFKR